MKIPSYISCAAVAVLFQVRPALGVEDCGCSSCTSSVLDKDADGYTVRDRIDWLIANMGQSETDACGTVCGDEFEGVCGSECDPSQCGARCGCSSCTASVLERDADGSPVGGRIDWVMANLGKSEEDACDLVCGVEYPDVCGECVCDGGGGGGDPKCAGCSWDDGSTCPDWWCNEKEKNCNVCTGTWFEGGDGGPAPAPVAHCHDPCIAADTWTSFQNFHGVGASMTGSSAVNIENVVSESLKSSILQALFDPITGIGLNLLRQPMGASDFSSEHYTYEDAQGVFDISKDDDFIIPALQSAMAVNPDIKIMGLPWSYPAWMKANGSLNGGSPRNNLNYNEVGAYFKNYIKEYSTRGLPVWAVSVQNEPMHSSNSYPTMSMTTEQHAAAATTIRSSLDSNGYNSVKVVAYDHNWDRPDYPMDVLADAAAYDSIDALAFHCYAGNVDAQSQVKQAYPDKEIFFTECTESGDNFFYQGDFQWAMNNLVFGSITNHASTVFEWNLILDANHGPKLPGGCSNCRGLLNLNADNSSFERSPAYFALGHLSKFVQYGAKRVASSSVSNLSSLAFENRDGTVVLIVHNDRLESSNVNIELAGKVCLDVHLPEMTTLSIVSDGSVVTKWESNFRDGNPATLLQNRGQIACANKA